MNSASVRAALRKNRRRGVGAIIGGVILAAILLTTIFAFFVTMQQNDRAKAEYEIQSNSANQDRITETFTVDRRVDLVSSGGLLYINNTVNNVGPIPMRYSHVLLYCISVGCPSDPVVNPASVVPAPPVTLNAGEGSNDMLVGPVSDTLIYRIDVISERGNIVSAILCEVAVDVCIVPIGGGGGSGEEPPPIDPKLLQQPQIQAIFPNPTGQTTGANQGVWGGVVANPTENPMSIRKLVITAISPKQGGDKIFDVVGSGACKDILTNIRPATGTWKCSGQNTLIWEITGAPLVIPQYSSQSFLVAFGQTGLTGSTDLPSYLVNYDVFTDYGQFAKTGYTSGTRLASSEVANAYLTTSPLTPLTKANIIGDFDIAGGTSMQVTAAIANFNAGSISSGTRLIINVPAVFTVNPTVTAPGFSGSGPGGACAPQIFTDGSTQINCTLDAALGTLSARTIQFTITAPPFEDHNKLYLLHVLADGTSTGLTVGPVSENVIRVIP